MKTLYFDCSSGAAGDMLSAALFELIDDKEEFLKELNNAGIPGVTTTAETAVKMGITGTHFRVVINGEEEKPAEVVHDHDHHHEHHEHHHHHHTTLEDITDIIDSLDIPDKVRADAINVYKIIAEAEGRVHGAEPGAVHFHEVGMLDVVADVVAVCWLIYKLNPELIMSSSVHTGSGTVECAHGIMPVPAPATALILRDVPIYSSDIQGELCTPTGAALIKYFVTKFGAIPTITMEEIGYGMGTKDFGIPNFIRAIIGETNEEIKEEPIKIRHPVSHTEEEKKIILNRLSRVTGHIDSIKRMVADNRDTDEILTQLSAVESSINSVSRVIIKSHFKHAINKAVETNDPHDLDSVHGLIDKFLKK
ncbi:MAG: DUF111 family protein [Clostridia bacterium]|nr:DUF111 family protein [Clostridia bacterium]